MRTSIYTLFRIRIAALGLAFGWSAGAMSAPSFTPADQPYGTVPPLALSGFNLSTGTQKAFQTWFNPTNWEGDVVAYPISSTGHTDKTSRIWSANAVFDASQACYSTDPQGSMSYYDTGRKIVTRGATFRWASLNAAQQASIGDATNGPAILNFIRGDRSNEKYQSVVGGDGVVQFECGVKAPGTGTFPARGNLLGDIIHSRPILVGAPPADYLFDNYQTYKTANANRAQRLYVGANDGMLHVFRADTGVEEWAYVPSMLIGNLNKLSTSPYGHTYFLDGPQTAGDVNFGSAGSPDWRTVLVGGLGAGGKGLYAIDATSPTAATEAAAVGKVLWEITPASAGFADLGHTYSEPVIARLTTGQWAVIVGNGYNNTATGRAVLYIIDIRDGSLIKMLDTGSGNTGSPNGLSSPTAVDTNFDGLVDKVYAGDIDGNLWKFDIGAASAASWTAPTAALFPTATDISNGAVRRPIIGAPDIAAHPISGYLVYFATGRLYTAADAADATVQNYAYGIWDGAPAANTTILNQTLTNTFYGAQAIRVSSGLPINWSDASNPSTNPLHKGWRTALPAGERVLGTGFVRDGRYHFTSVKPTTVNNPPPNGENWLNELDYLTGGVGDRVIFDLNSDNLLTDADRALDGAGRPVGGPAGIPVGVYEGAGLLSQPILAIISASLSTTMFNDNIFAAPGDVPPPSTTSGVTVDLGVAGGHFDVDLYVGTAKANHTHEYDDKFDVTGVNFLNASDASKNLSNAITSTATQFKILIANQRLSPAVNFSFGGNPYAAVTTLQTSAGLSVADLPTYTRANVTTLKYTMPRNAFESKDWSGTGDVRAGVNPTKTGCVNGAAPGTLGPNGEYRNGALVWQIIRHDTPDSAIQQSRPGDARYGYRLKDAQRATYILAEYSTFWHHDNGFCMGDAGWTATPPLVTGGGTAYTTPAAGSEDPPRDGFGTITGTTTQTSSATTTTTDAKGKVTTVTLTTTVTTTIYSSGARIIVTVVTDSSGKVVDTTTQTVLPPGGTTAGGVVPPNQSLSAPNTVTGYQQTRNSGKLGRVTWREIFGR